MAATTAAGGARYDAAVVVDKACSAAVQALVEQAKASKWVPAQTDPRLAAGFAVLKRPRENNRAHVDWLYITPNGKKLDSFLKAMRWTEAQQASSIEVLEVEAVVCSACGSAVDEATNDILLCDGPSCGLAFHQLCLPTPEAVPEGDWHCPGCRQGAPGRVLSESGPRLPDYPPTQQLVATQEVEPAAWVAKCETIGTKARARPTRTSRAGGLGAPPPGWTREEHQTASGRQHLIFCGPSMDGRRGYAESLQGAWRVHRAMMEIEANAAGPATEAPRPDAAEATDCEATETDCEANVVQVQVTD